MLPCFNPKHLALSGGLLLASLASAAPAAPAANGADGTASSASSTAVSGNGEVAVTRVAFLPVQDTYTKSNWMCVQVDFQGRAAGRAGIINDVSLTVTLGWSAKPPPAMDLQIAVTAKLIGVIPGKPCSALFFVPPETLARSPTTQPYDASRAPDYYVVQVKVGDSDMPITQGSFGGKLTAAQSAKGFAELSSVQKGLMLTVPNTPYYILTTALPRVSSNILPTVAPAADAGH